MKAPTALASRFSLLPVVAAVVAITVAAPCAEDAPPRGSLLLLHYQWKHDTLTLVDSKRVPAAVKIRRSSRLPVAPKPSWVEDAPRSPFSYELVGAKGNPIAVRFLQDPGMQHVEYQGAGDATLRREEHRVDSADIFLRVPEADAKTIRFFRHTPALGPVAPGNGAANGNPAAKTGAAQGPVTPVGTVTPLGPVAPATKTLLAEFPLE